MSFESILHSASFNLREIDCGPVDSRHLEPAEGKLGIVTGIRIPVTNDHLAVPQFDIALGPSSLWHNDLRDDTIEFLGNNGKLDDKPIEVLLNHNSHRRYITSATCLDYAAKVDYGARLPLPLHERHAFNQALSIGALGVLAAVVLTNYDYTTEQLPQSVITDFIRLVDADKHDAFATINVSKEQKAFGEVAITMNSDQVSKMLDTLRKKINYS